MNYCKSLWTDVFPKCLKCKCKKSCSGGILGWTVETGLVLSNPQSLFGSHHSPHHSPDHHLPAHLFFSPCNQALWIYTCPQLGSDCQIVQCSLMSLSFSHLFLFCLFVSFDLCLFFIRLPAPVWSCLPLLSVNFSPKNKLNTPRFNITCSASVFCFETHNTYQTCDHERTY